MKSFRLIGLFLPLCFFILLSACRNTERAVVPCDTDTDLIYRPLEPNEEGDTIGKALFGKDNIPGMIMDIEFPNPHPESYILFNKLTLLEINPAINQDLFDFIETYMKEENFVKESFSLPSQLYSRLIMEGNSMEEASNMILDMLKKGFEDNMEDQEVINAFNLTFQIYPVFLDDNYITYRQSCYSYTGGAHGMQYNFLKTYEISTGRMLTLEDIVKPDGIETVREEVVAHMAYSYPIYENITTVGQYLDSLNVWLGNFNPMGETGKLTLKDFPLPAPAITSEGLAFIYEMYELTPGSDGCPLVVIPYNDIKGCLYPKFEKVTSDHS